MRTPSEIERDQLEAEMAEQMRLEAEAKEQDDDEEVDISKIKKYSVDDITAGMDKYMKISKKKKTAADVPMESKTIQKGEKIKALRKSRKSVKSRAQLKF